MPLTAIRNKQAVEQALKERFKDPYPAPANLPVSHSPEMLFTGIDAVDQLSRGLPRGRISEIVGTASSGRTSLLLSMLAQVTDRDEVCALIDPYSIFDPTSAARMGVDLKRLLWIRATEPDIDPTLKVADLLLQGGGFGLIAVDLGEFSYPQIQGVPLSSWFRLQRVIENTSTILLFIGQEPCTRTSASLVLKLSLDSIRWTPHLLYGLYPQVEILRSRTHPGMAWSRRPERFCIRPAHFEIAANEPMQNHPLTTGGNHESHIEGVLSHEF